MSAVNFTVDDNSNRVVLRLAALPAALQRRLKATIAQLTSGLLATIKAGEPRRTGRLQSLTRSYVDEKPNWVRGRVRVLPIKGKHNIAAAALEYGAYRRFQVRAHRAQRAGGPVTIAAHQRRANIQARRFLRGPAAGMRPRARAELEAVIAKALREER